MRSTRTLAALTALLLAATTLMVGCPSGNSMLPAVAYSDDGDFLPKPSGAGLVVDPQSPIPDVPKPVGFVAVPSKSNSTVMAGGVRSVLHVYQGRSNTQDTAAFFRRNVDDFGWKTDGFDTGDPRATIQSYTKGPENLRINIIDASGIITINVHIAPRHETPS